MKKFPKIRYPGDDETVGLMDDEVVVTEKFDGANFRFTVDEDLNIVSGSRNVVFTEDGDPLPLDEINSAFRHAVRYLRDQLDEDDRGMINPVSQGGEMPQQVTLYGEAMHLHSLEYDVEYENPSSGPPYFKDEPNVILFDAMTSGGAWYEWDDFEWLAGYLDLPTVPVLERGDPDDLDFEIPDEGKYGPIEGIVARRVDGQFRAKKVSDDFKETNAQAFDDPSKAQSQAGSFVAAYITQPRIEKVARKLIDEGGYESLEMPMMEDLPRAVIEDAMAEEGWTMMTNDMEYQWDDDFKSEVRSKTSKKCARTLKQMLQEF